MVGDKKQVTRRGFLRGAAAAAPGIAAAGAFAAQKTPGRAPRWDKEADVVIVGSGFAGLSAAIAAKDAGAHAIILEKMPREHKMIYDAILNGDTEKARKAADVHIDRLKKLVEEESM